MEPHHCFFFTLFVITGIFMVPAQAQVIVQSLGISFNDGSNVIQEGSSSHTLNFNLSINLAPNSINANEDGNLNRWSLALQVQDSNSVACATAAVMLTPAQAGVLISAGGQGTLSHVNVVIDLSGCLCSSAAELMLNLTSNTYTLMPEPFSRTASLMCNGLIASSLTVITSGVRVVENEALQSITLNIIGNSESQGRSISKGVNYWAVEAYAATGNVTHNRPITSTRTEATVPPTQVSTAWAAGNSITLSGITVSLNLTGVGSCSNINVLCTSLTRNPTSTLEFSIEGGSIVSCAPIICIGVLINQLIPAFTSEVQIKQGQPNPGLNLTVTIKADNTKATVTGTNLWRTNVFGNAKADCSDPTQVPATVDFKEGTNYGLDINSQTVWPLLSVSLDMSQYGCSNARYICVVALRGLSPSPDFTLSFNPVSSRYGAVAVSCDGLDVVSGSFSVNPATPLAAFKDDHTLQFSATFTSSATSGSVTGTDLWELVVYPAENNDNTGRKGQNTMVLLQTSQLNTAFPGSGGTLMFQGLSVTISLVANPCGTYNYLCGWLRNKATANPSFDISTPNQPFCSQILSCKNVTFTSSTVEAAAGSSPNGLPLYEGVSDQDIYLDIALESEQSGGSVPSGTRHWQFTVTPGDVLAELTDPQTNALMIAGQTLSFTRVKATLDLSNQRCYNLSQVCAEIMRSSDSTLNFAVDSTSAQNTGCFTPDCQGVEITSLVIDDGVTNFALKEGTQNHMLTFSVIARTNPAAGSVRGLNLWQMLVYLSMSDSTKSLDVSADAMTGPWESQDVLASAETTTFSDIQVSLNLDTTCANMRFLCVELRKADRQTFLLDPALNSLQTCKPVPMCNGIGVASTSVSLGSGAPVVEGVPDNVAVVEVSLSLTDTSSDVIGSNIWMVTIYGSGNAEGTGERIEEQTSITSGSSNPMDVVPLDGINWDVNMTGRLCADVTHICVEVELVANASYSLVPTINHRCSPLDCQGIVIVSEDFTLTATNIFEARAPVPQVLVTTTISAQASANGASIPDDAGNIWEVSLFLNSASDGSGMTFDTVAPTGSLSPQDQRQGISSGNPLTFTTNLQFEFTVDVLCGSALYVCLEISEQTGASPNYDITFPPTPTCKEISCTGVVFTSTNLTLPANARLIENNPTQQVTVTFQANSAPVTATLQQGSNFWQLSVFASTQPDGGTESQRYGQTMAMLTQAQKNTELLVSDTVELASVPATMNLQDFVCPSLMIYLCAELQRDPQSMTRFTIQGMPSPLVACELVECQGVLITSIDIEGVPSAIIENEENPLNLNVTVGVGGADASGTNLWRMQASLVYNGTELSTVDVDLGSQASADIVSGEPITFSNLMVPFDLSQTVCPSSGMVMLCLELSRAGSADANFTVTGEPMTCMDVPCLGVVIVQSSVRASTGNLLEGRASNPITLDVSYTSDPNGASISGTGLWSVTFFGNSQEDGSGTRMAQTVGTLQGNDESFPLAKGQTVEFNSVSATLNLSPYLVCAEVRWVCAELNKGAAPSMDFSLKDKNKARVTCTNIDCTGVQVSSTILTLSNIELTEDSGTQMVRVNNVTIVGGPGSSTLPNRDDNLKVVVFGNSIEDTSGPRVAKTELPVSLSSQRIAPGMSTRLFGTVNLNLTGVFCADLKYLCVRVQRGDNPRYPFKFEGVPNENSLIDCAAVTCKGVRVSSGTVDTTAIVREGNSDYPIEITVTFNTDISGASVRAGSLNFWKLVAFLASTADGMAPKTPVQNVSLPQGSESQPVQAGNPVTFVDAVARVDTTAWTCQAQNFICVRLLKDPESSANYLLEGWDAASSTVDPSKLQACRQISCRGVNITNVVLQTNQSVFFLERDNDAPFSTDIGLVADPDGGGVTGTSLWNLTFMLNSQPDGTGEQLCTVTVAMLSEANANRAVDPNGLTTVLQDVEVTLSLGSVLCSNSSAFYLCVKVTKAADSNPDFTLTAGDWNCTEVTCYPVRVNDLSFKVTTPSYIVENTNNYLHIDLNVAADPLSASISGTSLWASPSFEMLDATNTTTLTSTGAYWTPDRQNVALSAGEMAEFDNIFPVTFSPNGILCNQLTKLCMTFEKGPNPTPAFGLEFLVHNEVCVDITCRGVEIISTVLTAITAGATVVERHPAGQDVNITVTSRSSADGASISGTDLWSLTIYYTPHADGLDDATFGSAAADLTSEQRSRQLVAGTDLVLEHVGKASLDVSNLVCPQGNLYLCARLERNTNPSPLFTLSPYNDSSAVFIGCGNVTCIGVEMEETTLTVGRGALIPVERTSNHEVQFSFTSTPSGRTAALMGTQLWRLIVFGNRRQDGSHHRRPYQEDVALTMAQMNRAVDPPLLLVFSAREVQLNLQATPCRHTPYFCGQLLKGTNPSPDFSLHGFPDDSRLVNCRPLDCTGVKIATFSLTNTGSDILRENQANQMFTFDVQLMSDSTKSAVSGDNLWTYRAYLNDAPDCLGLAEEVALTTASVRAGQEDQDLPAGATISFNVDASLDYRMKCPSWDEVYICLEVFVGDTSTTGFTLFGDIVKGAQIECRGVEVTQTLIREVNRGQRVVEDDDNLEFDLNLRVSSNAEASSIMGTGLWSVDVFTSDTTTCQMATTGPVTSPLSTFNRDKMLTAGGTLLLNNIQATVPRGDTLCEDIRYVCARLAKGPNPSPDFTLVPKPDDSALLGVAEIECIGLRITSTRVSLTEGEPLITNEPQHAIALSFVFSTDPLGSSVRNPTNLFQLQVAATDTPSRAGVVASQHRTLVPYNPPAPINIAAGQTFTLPLQADLNLNGARCDEIPYICVTLMKGVNAAPPFTLAPSVDEPVMTACTERVDCVGVRVVDEDLMIKSGIPFVEHAMSNQVDLVVSLTADEVSGSAIGMNLWSAEVKLSFEDPLAPGTQFYAVSTGTFVGDDVSKSLLRGQTVEFRLTADLNLDGVACSATPYLVVNITNPNADPEFTLEWDDGRDYIVVSKTFSCVGVSFDSVSLTISNGFPLRELAPNNNVTLSVGVAVNAASATVTGTNLWEVRAFVSDDPSGAGVPENEKRTADLSPAQGAVPIIASAVSNINNIDVWLDTAGKYCSDMTYLCVEVWRGSSAQPYYNIQQPTNRAGLRSCRMTQCNGVQIDSVHPIVSSEAPLIEMRPNQDVTLELTVVPTRTSAGIDGDNLWAATVFVSSQPDGSGPRFSVREAVIPAEERNRDLLPNSQLTLEDLQASMDFTGVSCSQMRYICVTLRESDQAQPDFNLDGGDALTNCTRTNCISVAIASASLTLVSNEILEGDNMAMFSFDASFLPWTNSHALQEDNSWQLQAYTSDRGDRHGTVNTPKVVSLTDVQENQGVVIGTPLAFNNREVTLDLSSLSCAAVSHLCVILGTQAGVSFVLGGYLTPESLVGCAELRCFPKNVDLYSTEVTERLIRVEFSEAFGDFNIYVLTYSPPDGITTSPSSIPRNLERRQDFDQLVPGKQYTIQLTLNDGDQQKAGPFTLVERTRPDPVELQLDSVTSTELTVSWDEADGIFEYYTIHIDPQDNSLPRTPLNVYPVEERRVSFTGLLAAQQYNVTIYTISGNKQSRPSTVIANTDPSTPVLTTTGNGETTVDLEWFIDRGQIVDQYEIRYEPNNNGSGQPLIYPKSVTSTTVTGLVPGRKYDFTLVAVSNINGVVEIRSTPATVSVQTLPKPPSEITYEDATETSIRILWPSAEGELDYYTVIFTPSVDLSRTVVPRSNPRELFYQGLDVASEYTVTITSHVAADNGELVSRPVQRIVSTLPYPPGPITIIEVTTTTIEFRWQDALGPRDGYEVTFDPNEPEFLPQSPYFTTGNTMLLTGIKPHVTVDFQVRTKVGDVASRPQELRQRTFPTVPGPVRDFEITGTGPNYIEISFKIPEFPNGLILAYLVSIEGTKPGQPDLEPTFQTITAFPNDVQFNEIISPLIAGYTYTLSIRATNAEGSGEPVTLDAVTLPIQAPHLNSLTLPNDQFILQVTSSTVRIRIPRSLFSDRNGLVTSYTILVVGAQAANQTAGPNPPSYQQVRNNAIKPVYQSSEPLDLFNVARRRRRQTTTTESVEFVIGEETNCPNFGYCNGPLDPITQYRVRIRAATENGLYTDAPWSDVVTTRFDPSWFVYALIPYIIIVLILAFIMCLCVFIAGDKKKQQRKKQTPRNKKSGPTVDQPNENSSNNIITAGISQERLVPDSPPLKRGPISRPVAVVKFRKHMDKMSARTGENFAREFEDLNLLTETEAKTVGALPQNVDKNRFGNIIPYDFNRVCLNSEEDYINASLISGFSGDDEYIAAQGPQANSVNDFWQMIWEQNVPIIAVIGNCVERGKVKFAQYWPSDFTPITFGDVTINKVSEREETERGYVVRDLCLESGSEVRALRQFQFTAWPIHGVPKNSEQLLHFIRTVRSKLPPNAGPLLAHCGAGIGRTGVFIVLDILTQQLAVDDETIDVFGTVASKRKERTNMVQTELQYEFVHRAILDILEGRVTGPNWLLKSRRRGSTDSDQQIDDNMAEATM